MSDVVIRAEGLGKRYRIGRGMSHSTLRDSIAQLLQRRLPGYAEKEHIWALKDVDFEVRRGELVGVLGRNGAGKSTLLKILSRITHPTEGRLGTRGRVGSLLEVGTGFHHELSGRENIFLNGAILGMRREEIRRRFDEIVAFAGVETFIDTPVKHYSSGMYMRLAFAVAVHLEPEILVVDEVLAVGDAEFQKKCLAKMLAIGRDGRTILFVSHNIAAMRQICQRGIFMERGQVVAQGEINAIADYYLSQTIVRGPLVDLETDSFVVDDVSIQSAAETPTLKTFAPFEVRVRVRAKVDIKDIGMYIGFLTLEHQRLAGLDFKDFQTLGVIKAGEGAELLFRIESLPLLPGSYQLELHLKDMFSYKFEIVPQQFLFEVVETPVYGGRALTHWFGTVGLRASTRGRIIT